MATGCLCTYLHVLDAVAQATGDDRLAAAAAAAAAVAASSRFDDNHRQYSRHSVCIVIASQAVNKLRI